jgi:hypothetical protein
MALLIIASAALAQNKWYPINRTPMKQTKFVVLPVTTVKPDGWLLKQLQLMSTGITGNMFNLDPSPDDDMATFIKNSKWRNDTYTGDRWEAGPYYLDGLAPLAFLLDSARLKTEVMSWINTMLKHRADWFGTVSNDDIWGSTIAWKVLRSWYESKEVAGTLTQTDTSQFNTLTRNYFRLLTTGQYGTSWAFVRGNENLLALTWWYRRTGDGNAINNAATIKSKNENWTPLYNTMRYGTNDLRNPQGWYMQGHVVNHGMAIKFGSIYWPFLNATAADSQAAFNAVINMNKYHGHIAGSFSGDESLGGLAPWHGTETCAIVEQMYSYENMIETFGVVDWADKLEYLTYNHLPGHMTPDGWNRQYHGQVNQVKVSSEPRSWMSSGNDANLYGNFNCLFRCCTANLHQGWPKFVVHTWMATQDNGVAAIVYAPSTITAKVGTGTTAQTVTIKEETDYPFKGQVKFTVVSGGPATFPLVVRVPRWGYGTTITAAGATITAPGGGSAASGLNSNQWVTISKNWANGDIITVNLPMKLRAEVYNGGGTYSGTTETFSKKGVAIARGPLFFGLRVAASWTKLLQYRNSLGAAKFQITNPDGKWNYALCMENFDQFQVVEQNIDAKYPWGQRGDMVYDAATSQHVANTGDVPVIVKAKAKRVTAWTMANNSAADVPTSPLTNLGSVAQEDVELVPHGSARLRISVFPWTGPADPTTVSAHNPLIRKVEPVLLHMVTPQGLSVIVKQPASHRIDIVTLRGQVVKSFSGDQAARYTVSRDALAQGTYLMRAKINGSLQTAKITL